MMVGASSQQEEVTHRVVPSSATTGVTNGTSASNNASNSGASGSSGPGGGNANSSCAVSTQAVSGFYVHFKAHLRTAFIILPYVYNYAKCLFNIKAGGTKW